MLRWIAPLARVLAPLLACCALAARAEPVVQTFTPTGTVKGVRQVQVRFGEQMVAFGDPRLPAPFDIDCLESGTARWADARNWVYDFARDLPAGVRCTFTLKRGLTTLAGQALAGEPRFAFDTGGPAILQSEPYEGAVVDEDQVFLLGLDAPADAASIEEHVQCRADGIAENVGVRLLTGEERQKLLGSQVDFLRRFETVIVKDRHGAGVAVVDVAEQGTARERFLAGLNAPDAPLAVLQCKQRFPNGAKVYLDWGAGVRSASGVATTETQTLGFETREAFRARFSCERINKNAHCIPALDFSLDFTAPVARKMLEDAKIVGSQGEVRKPRLHGEARDEWTNGLTFKGPFPERVKFRLELPAGIVDDAGRALVNQDSFPLEVRTDEDPPLAKFAADFGIVELYGGAALPVTVRNLEANAVPKPVQPPAAPSFLGFLRDVLGTTPQPDVLKAVEPAALTGRVLHVEPDDAAALVKWFAAREEAGRDDYAYDDATERYVTKRHAGELSLLKDEPSAEPFTLPRPEGAKTFEVLGIPLRDPGFYVVEIASPKLGAALFGKPGTYYVQALALATNLGVHFKWGRESSAAWVTTLDKGAPVKNADVEVEDCTGRRHWSGKTDEHGVALIPAQLPASRDLPACAWNSHGYLVSARQANDVGVVATSWSSGIQTWQFGLPNQNWNAPKLATTVFDRTLFRAGETVHMKHVLRHHTMQGFDPWPADDIKARVRHEGSEDTFVLEPKAVPGTGNSESTWEIPADAKQGTYQVEIEDAGGWLAAGSFRVESFRVPLMRATLKATPQPAVNPPQIDLDVQVSYLAGGGAADQPVKLRGLVEARPVSFEDYADFTFMNGNVKEGVQDLAEQSWRERRDGPANQPLGTQDATLDGQGGARLQLANLPHQDTPQTVVAELEYRDPNGEILTASSRVPLWPAHVVLGLKPDGWAVSKDKFRFQVLALNLHGQPRAQQKVDVDLLKRDTYSHRKRLIGGFYAYENKLEVKRLGAICSGETDGHGILECTAKSPVDGNVILRAIATDEAGNKSYVNRDVWIAGREDWWYEVGNEDRMSLLPERKRYEPGETAKVQVRMPFREATALVTIEREGVIDSFVTKLSGKSPVVEVPIKPNYAPNAFVSVLALRGRDDEVQPTALVDLGRPAYKLGITELQVGWRAHELSVKVEPDAAVHKVREKVPVKIHVATADGSALAPGAEVALAAVDEGLLELKDNESWKLLETMMGRRGEEVQTSTAQMQVVGKRHYGRKAVPQGGGGGSAAGSRVLFDTLLTWSARVALDANGEASVEVPLNDSLTSFRIVAVATAGASRFGTGSAVVRSTQDLMLFAGVPPLVREGDRFRAGFTVRNASDRPLEATVTPEISATHAEGEPEPLPAPAAQTVSLAPGTAQEMAFEVTAPYGATGLAWTVRASAGETSDRLSVNELVIPAVAVRTFQATLLQLAAPFAMQAAIPADAVPGRGGIDLTLKPKLGGDLDGVREYMTFYDYICLEQLVSKAVALQDDDRWDAVMALLPTFLDADGLARYFAGSGPGSDTLTAYVLAIAAASGREIPDGARARMEDGLKKFIEGRIHRESALKTADLALRKLAAIEALSRYPEGIDASWLETIDLQPNLWPTSGVIDYLDVLRRTPALPDRDQRLKEVQGILRSRLNFQGTTMTFSTEKSDALWWLMISADVNANRAILALLEDPEWREDMPRLVTGSLGRMLRGHWSTTIANAWGVVALDKFAQAFEQTPVAGTTRATLGTDQGAVEWSAHADGGSIALPWPAAAAGLEVKHDGDGKPWLTVQSRAAIPLEEPFSAGYTVKRSVTPVSQKTAGRWQRGDVYRVHLEIEAQSDMTWVVVRDPIPAGASILGTGLGRDSQILSGGEQKTGEVWPAFEERTFESFRSYYEFVPKGRWTVEYSVRLNNAGAFMLPETRVEAMYAPEMFAELPNATLEVAP
ncbi:MAG: alpha-2-macroglobulin [Gammaproteobacteria bacterium]|nr:alpha-2-macroglobulin [Gammaproteobacteria bacterium]